MNHDLEEILNRHDEAIKAWRQAEEQLDFALESNRSITRALRNSRRARNAMINTLLEANRLVLKVKNKE